MTRTRTQTVFIAASFLVLSHLGFGQGFINLGFESASLVPAGSFYVQFGPAFPGWIGTVGGVQQSLALSNTFYLDTSGISIINRNYDNLGLGGGVIQGNYTAILQAGYAQGVPADTSLSQTGLIPFGTESLQFDAYQVVGGASPLIPFTVTLGNQTLSPIPLGTGANYTLYGADISSFAGQTEQLTFTVTAENPHVDNQFLYLDGIQFSSSPIPEPNTLYLTALGGLLLAPRIWRDRRSFLQCRRAA